jgi:hypothetical protein
MIYDIVYQDNNGIIKCINDTKEKLIFQKLDHQINSFFANTSIGKKSLKNINSVFFSVYLPTKTISIPTIFDFISSNNFQILVSFSNEITPTIFVPPPKFI